MAVAAITPARILELAKKADVPASAVKTILADLGIPLAPAVVVPEPVQISVENWRIGDWRIDLRRKYDYPPTPEKAEERFWHIRTPSNGLLCGRDTLEEAFDVVRAHYDTVV